MTSIRSGILLTLTALALASCVDSKEVLVDKPLVPDLASTAQGFVGYSDTTSGKPVCGNCHIGKYNEWQGTKHSHAWEDLQASDHASSSCEPCHTVNANGNWVDTIAGFTATGEARYHDVQCESCHGPGLEHLQNPDATQPLASIMVSVDRTNGCGECHQGTHNGFVDEWQQSLHADTTNHGATNGGECGECHNARGVLDAWGVKATYVEQDSANIIPIVCVVCHDPHDAANEYQLRYPIDVRDVDGQLCMKCHHYRAVPDPATFRGPMSPQGPLLLGQAGWRAPDFMSQSDDIVGTHGTSANKELCATCHMYKFAVTDASGATTYNVVGHLFQAIPCIDSAGMPNTGDCELAQRDFDACAQSGCHGAPGAARSAYAVARQRLDDLEATLNAMLAQVPETEFVTGDDLITTAEGAKFNVALTSMDGTPAHNPFLAEALLTASIKQMEKDYGLQAAPTLQLANILKLRK